MSLKKSGKDRDVRTDNHGKKETLFAVAFAGSQDRAGKVRIALQEALGRSLNGSSGFVAAACSIFYRELKPEELPARSQVGYGGYV